MYKVALDQTENYDDYLEGIGRMTEKYNKTEFFFVLYHEVIMAIGPQKLGEFCKKHGITNVISGDLHDEEAEREAENNRIREIIAGSVN